LAKFLQPKYAFFEVIIIILNVLGAVEYHFPHDIMMRLTRNFLLEHELQPRCLLWGH
jgi:hypothetical protein